MNIFIFDILSLNSTLKYSHSLDGTATDIVFDFTEDAETDPITYHMS